MQIVQGNLTMMGLNTETPQIFWNGLPVGGITKVNVEWTDKEQEVKIRVNGSDDAVYMEMVSAGINIKKGK